ncbi:MAG: hypothetical protein RIM99_03145 [Cyclobacteriaceae bacterium]
MKILLTGIFIATAMFSGSELQTGENQAKLEIQLSEDDAFQNKVKIFDYKGNLVTELTTNDVANHNISISEYLILESSDYAFTHLGDYYYFRD